MKIAFDREKTIELKNKLAKEFPERHRKEMKKYTIKLIISCVLLSFGAFLCIITATTKSGVDLGIGAVVAAITTVISVCAIAHYHDERVAEIYDYEENSGKYRLPPSVVYLNLTNKGEIFSIEQGEDTGEHKLIRFYAKDSEDKVITDAINVKKAIVAVSNKDIQEVLDLDSGKLLVPRRIKDTTVEEIDNAYAYLKGM